MNTLFAGLGRSVLVKTVISVLSTARGLRPWAVLKTSGTVFPNTDLPAGNTDGEWQALRKFSASFFAPSNLADISKIGQQTQS